MQKNHKIQCSVAVLTYNSEKTLKQCLQSAVDFAEIIICDGGSTDSTIDIAKSFGCKIIAQDLQYKNQDGTIADFAGVRNQMLVAASFDWQFHLDSDEMLTKKLVSEIRARIEDDSNAESFVYLVPRKYIYQGESIERSINYPSYQYRFFNRKHVTQFTKKIHERIRFDQAKKIGKLRNAQLVPIDVNLDAVWSSKYLKYIEMEAAQNIQLTMTKKLVVCFSLLSRVIKLLVRLFTRRIFRRGKKLPLRFDLIVIKYQFVLFTSILKSFLNNKLKPVK